MKKKVTFGTIILVGLFVVADYCGLFGFKHSDIVCVIPLEFQFMDSKEKPINNVTVTASLSNGHSRSTFEYDDKNPSLISGFIHIGTSRNRTILFSKPFREIRVEKEEVRLLFKHPDYLEQERIFLVEDIKGRTHTIVLQPKEQSDE
jgi:hypothetical protein